MLTLAHAAAHGLGADSDQCSTCLRAGQYKTTAVDTPVAAVSFIATGDPHLFPLPPLADAIIIGQRARGPPLPDLA